MYSFDTNSPKSENGFKCVIKVSELTSRGVVASDIRVGGVAGLTRVKVRVGRGEPSLLNLLEPKKVKGCAF